MLWRDSSTSWEPLCNLKESIPIKLAEYAIACHIANEPAFAWWVPYVIKMRDRIIAHLTTRYKKHTHKFVIEVPTSVEHSLDIDRQSGTTFWYDAIQKEMKNVEVTLQFLQLGEQVPIGYKCIPIHMIFDVKMD